MRRDHGAQVDATYRPSDPFPTPFSTTLRKRAVERLFYPSRDDADDARVPPFRRGDNQRTSAFACCSA